MRSVETWIGRMAQVVVGLAGEAKAAKALCAEWFRREWGANRVHLDPSATHDRSHPAWPHDGDSRDLKTAVDGTTVLLVVDDVETADDIAAVRRMNGIIVEIDDARHDDRTAAEAAPDHRVTVGASARQMFAQIDDIAANLMD